MIGLPLAIGGIMLAVARPNGAQDRPTGDRAAKSGSGTVHANTAVNTVSGAQIDSADEGTGDDRRPLNYYTSEVRSNMFSAPQPPPPKPVITKAVAKPAPQIKVVVPPVNPYATYAYTGTVKVGDQMMALIENTSNKDGEYVKIGDSFQGGQVTNITDEMVTLKQGGKPYELAKSDNIVITPLNAPPQTAPQPGGPQDPNAQPGQQPPWMQGGRGAWRQMMMQQMQNGGGAVTLPNGQVLNANQAARRNNFLNRRFNGGGGGGGGFNGGGGGFNGGQ
jgi:hypothetical protein